MCTIVDVDNVGSGRALSGLCVLPFPLVMLSAAFVAVTTLVFVFLLLLLLVLLVLLVVRRLGMHYV